MTDAPDSIQAAYTAQEELLRLRALVAEYRRRYSDPATLRAVVTEARRALFAEVGQ